MSNTRRPNKDQEDALRKLIDKLDTERGIKNPPYKTKINPVKLQVFFDLQGFPEIDIGNGGGFDMPHIRSYAQSGTRDTLLAPPQGKTAFDACLFGDEHVKLQGDGAWKDAWFVPCI
ncbi:MAG TPA: hypothetical protein VGH51_04425 [Candidatus Angelobacter sp.]|jgi:hypothetical protein